MQVNNSNMAQLLLSSSKAFSVIQEKTVSITSVSLCPKMDLIALLTTDGAVVILRSISWQKLHAIPATDLQENRVTTLAWCPDGNVLALGHERGGISIFDIEQGESFALPFGGKDLNEKNSKVMLLSWVTQYHDRHSLSAFDIEKDISREYAAYYLEREDVFLEELSTLGPQAGSSFASQTNRKEQPMGMKLTADPRSWHVLVACLEDGQIVILGSGILPLWSVHTRSLLFSSSQSHNAQGGVHPSMMLTPTKDSSNQRGSGGGGSIAIDAVALTLELSSLFVTLQHDDNHGKRSYSLLAIDTSTLWQKRHHFHMITREFSALSACMVHLQEALDLAEKSWKEAVRVLDIKLELLNQLLRDYACEASAREAFLSFVLSGVPCPALNQYLSQNSSEPQQYNMFRLSKTIDEKCSQMEALLREQIGRVAEMMVYRISRLRGAARMDKDFEGTGLSEEILSALLHTASRLSLKAEETVREVQQARQNLKVFLLWLLDTMQHLPGAETNPPRDLKALSFRNSSKHVKLLLNFLRKPCPPDGAKLGNTEAVINVQVSAYFRDDVLPVPFVLPLSSKETTTGTAIASEEKEEYDKELRSISLRRQLKELQALFLKTFKMPWDRFQEHLPSSQLLHLTSSSFSSSASSPQLYPQSSSMMLSLLLPASHTRYPNHLLLLSIDTTSSISSSSSSLPLSAVMLRPPGVLSSTIQQAAFYGQVPGISSQNEDALILLLNHQRPSSEMVLTDENSSSSSSSSPFTTSLCRIPLKQLMEQLQPWPSVAAVLDDDDDSEFALEVLQPFSFNNVRVSASFLPSASHLNRYLLSVTGPRGVAVVCNSYHQLVLLDMEEDENDDDDNMDL